MTARAAAVDGRSPGDGLDLAIGQAEAGAIVYWRGEPLPLALVPERISRISVRAARELLYGSWAEAVEALNPLYADRLRAWKEAGSDAADATRLTSELALLGVNIETPYHAALRRYLALIGIESGDASEADLWHVMRGGRWLAWFGDKEVERAVNATGRGGGTDSGHDGWRAAEHRLLSGGSVAADPDVAAAIGQAYASLVGSTAWLSGELGINAEAAGEFADFAAFVRTWRIKHRMALLVYQRRLFETDDPALQRAYYAGVIGHLTGVAIAEAGYLAAIRQPNGAPNEVRQALLAAMLLEVLEREHGVEWWRAPGATSIIDGVAAATGMPDAVARLGYDGPDWKPVLRLIQARLIGEMSGYGGPNITTRAGTRKV